MFGRKPFFYRIPRYILVLITLVLLVLSGVVMYFYTVNQNPLLMTLTIILTILFVISMNATISRFAVFKPKPIKYPKAYYEGKSFLELDQTLTKQGFNRNSQAFGEGFIKIEGKTAYKVLLVDRPDIYFDPDKKEVKQKPTKGIEKCTRLIGFEIFFKTNDEVLKRIPDFSFKGDKVLYDGFYFDEEKNQLVEANKIDVAPHNEQYKRMIEILGLKEIEKKEDGTKK